MKTYMVNVITRGGIRYTLYTGLSWDEAELICDENNWSWDVGGYLWDMEILECVD